MKHKHIHGGMICLLVIFSCLCFSPDLGSWCFSSLVTCNCFIFFLLPRPLSPHPCCLAPVLAISSLLALLYILFSSWFLIYALCFPWVQETPPLQCRILLIAEDSSSWMHETPPPKCRILLPLNAGDSSPEWRLLFLSSTISFCHLKQNL